MTLTINVRPTFNSLYVLEPHVSYDPWSWKTKPAIRIANRVKVSFGTKAGAAIDKALAKAADKINQDLPRKLDFQNKMRTVWETLHDPISITPDRSAWIMIEPLSLHVTPMISDAQYARIYATMRSKNEIILQPNPPSQDVVALPILQPGKPSSDFSVTAMLRLRYDEILRLLRNEWKNRTLSLSWGQITFKEFALYQSGRDIVVGTNVYIQPKKFINVSGWIYLSGSPRVVGGKLVLQNLDYRANTDNIFVQGMAYFFKPEAKRELQEKLTVDVEEKLNEVTRKINEMPDRDISDVSKLTISVRGISIGDLAVDADELIIPVSAEGTAEVMFDPFSQR